MKKKLIILSVCLTARKAFAYGSYYGYGSSSENVGEIITVIVLLIFFALNIILFFKIWGMCNNVKKILYHLEDWNTQHDENYEQPKRDAKEKGDQLQKETYKKESQPAKYDDDLKQKAMMQFNEECLCLFRRCNTKQDFESKVDYIIDKYNKKVHMNFSTLKDGLWEQFMQL